MATGYTRIGGNVFPYEIPEPKAADKPKRGRRRTVTVEPLLPTTEESGCSDDQQQS